MTDMDDVQTLFDSALEHRAQTQALIKSLQKELSFLFTKSVIRPRDTLAGVQEKIDKLEHDRTIVSMSLKDERVILKQIYKQQKVKREIEAFEEYDKRIKSTKKRVASLRTALQSLNQAIADLRVKVALQKTAKDLNCSIESLVGVKVDIPTDQAGRIIGKNGKNVKEIMENANVTIDVLPNKGQVHIVGPIASLEGAKQGLNRIIDRKEETVMGDVNFVDYMTSKGITALNELRARHPGTNVDINRKSGQIVMRGYVDDLESLKLDIASFDINSKSIEVPPAVVTTIIGKQGSTIQQLVEKHQATIKLVKDNSEHPLLYIAGPMGNMESLITEINDIVYENEESEREIVAGQGVRNVLLRDGAKAKIDLVNKVQKQLGGGSTANINMTFNDANNIVVKGKSKQLSEAVEMVEKEVSRLQSLSFTFDVDKFAVSRIIGRKGETIKAFSKSHPGVSVEFDNKTGSITLTAASPDDMDSAKAEFANLVAENDVEYIDVDSHFYERMFKELTKSPTWKEMSELVFPVTDQPNSQLILRGKRESIDAARNLFTDFLSKSHTERVPVSSDEINSLLNGGKSSKIVEFSKAHSVNLKVDKDESCVIAKGDKQKTADVIATINKFLHGGDGRSVHHMTFDEQHIGVVIGKGGSAIKSFEESFPNVQFIIHHKSASLTLRGPDSDVKRAVQQIKDKISSSRISKTLQFTEEQMKKLGKRDLVLLAVQHIPVRVEVKTTKNEVSMRGISDDIEDAAAILREKAGMVYEKRIKIEPLLASKYLKSVKESDMTKTIEGSSEARIIVDDENECIIFRGTSKTVKAAKKEMYKQLEFIIGSGLVCVAIPDAAVRILSFENELPAIQADTGAQISLDRDDDIVLVQSSTTDNVTAAKKRVEEHIKSIEDRCCIITLDSSDNWIMKKLIGKSGAQIKDIRSSTDCRIAIESNDMTISISGDTKEKVQQAKQTIEDFIAKSRKLETHVKLSGSDAAAFIGRKGANITAFEKEHNVRVQREGKEEITLKLSGDDDNVEKARQALTEWLASRESNKEESYKEDILKVYRRHIPAIIGEKGNTIRKLESESGCKINIDKTANLVKVRGGSEEKRAEAMEKIKTLMAEEDIGEDRLFSPGVIGTPISSNTNKVNGDTQQKNSAVSKFFSDLKSDFPSLQDDKTSNGGSDEVSATLSWSSLFANNDGNGAELSDDEPPPLIEDVLSDGAWHSIAETSIRADQELKAMQGMEEAVRRKLESIQIKSS